MLYLNDVDCLRMHADTHVATDARPAAVHGDGDCVNRTGGGRAGTVPRLWAKLHEGSPLSDTAICIFILFDVTASDWLISLHRIG